MKRILWKTTGLAGGALLLALLICAGGNTALAGKPAPPPPPLADQAIVYSTGGSYGDIRIMNVDGTGDRLVLANAILAYRNNVSWAPGGQEIAFRGEPLNTDGTRQPKGIYAIRPDGSGLRMLTTSSPGLGVAWSPVSLEVGGISSAWILFYDLDYEQGTAEITAIRSDANASDQSSRVTLTEPTDAWSDKNPTWSSDGSRFATIATAADDVLPPEVRVYTLADVSGQLQVSVIERFPLPPGAVYGNTGLSWARTQDKLVGGIKLAGDDVLHLAILDLIDGSFESYPPLQYVDAAIWSPVWSPLDDRIAFYMTAASNKNVRNNGLYIMETVDPSTTTRVSTPSGYVSLDWRR